MENFKQILNSFQELEQFQQERYVQQLKQTLQASKQSIQCVLQSQIQQAGQSDETDIGSLVNIKQILSLAKQNQRLFQQLRQSFEDRQNLQSKSLIVQQINKESNMKYEEQLQEFKQQNQALLDRLKQVSSTLEEQESKNFILQDQIRNLQCQSTVLMGLTEESLNYHKELEKYKDVLSRESKLYEKTEMQKQELQSHAKRLEVEVQKYQILEKNPKYRQREVKHVRRSTFTQCQSFIFEQNSSSSSDSEVNFPNKINQLQSQKPQLPKLNLAFAQPPNQKNANKHLKDAVISQKQKMLEMECQTRNQELADLRKQIEYYEKENANLVNQLLGNTPIASTAQTQHKRAASNELEYFINEENGDHLHKSRSMELFTES